jgi:coenzyme F420-dependent glucose-6-phosphate dehydrogenase
VSGDFADESEAKRTAYEWWPNKAFAGELGQELPLSRHFEQAAEMVTAEEVAEAMPHGPDPKPYIDAIVEYAAAGFDHVYLHQVGPRQEEFIRFMERQVLAKVH